MAIAILSLKIAGAAEDPTAQMAEGVKYYRAGKYKEAIGAYDRAIKTAPNAAEAYLGRGSAYAKLRQNEQAIRNYDDAIRLNPDLADHSALVGDARQVFANVDLGEDGDVYG